MTVVDVRTGKAIAAVTLPPVSVGGNNATVGVSATADDRSFVVGGRNSFGAVYYYLVHIAPGTKQGATFESLPIPEVEVGAELGFAVSPDGSELAVLSARGNGTTLRIYSTKSGATLRTWIAGTWHSQSTGQALTAGVSWTADGRHVAFSTAVNSSGGPLEEHLISATAPGGDLATASRVVFRAPGDCSSLLLTPDGGTVVCATQTALLFNVSPSHPPTFAPCGGKNGPMFAAYSAATGKLLRVLYQYTGTCSSGTFTVLWTDDSAQHVIGERDIDFQVNPPHYTDGWVVAAAGQATDIPVRLSGQWYSGPAF